LSSEPLIILGGGPAGASAALAALAEGSAVRVVEKSKFPRHKVCGEFLSPEIQRELDRLGMWQAFLELAPARVRRMSLYFDRREKHSRLPEPAWGLSRYAFDALLLGEAERRGAEVVHDLDQSASSGPPHIIATGRSATAKHRGSRLFGFKAHFEGPPNDAVELYFFGRCYVGVSAIEQGRTNVCGLAPEDWLREINFDHDSVMRHSTALAARIAPLTRSTQWFSTGPLEFGQRLANQSQYLAGDALSFVDPFTGSGLLAGVTTGSMAGQAAARNTPVSEYSAACRGTLRRPFEVASLLRGIVDRGWAPWMATVVPGRLLFSLTRPHL
jgi:flavin-dependent dehydrogenase